MSKKLTALTESSQGIPRHEIEALICHYGRMSRLEFFTHEKILSASAKAAVSRALQKRRRGIPLAYVTKKAPFWGHEFFVQPGALIPRPETERLVEEVLGVLKADFSGKKPEILDLGTGSGCIAVCLTLEWPACKMTALDTSLKALEIARKNIELFGLGQKIRLVHSQLFESVGVKIPAWDIIVSNPPYVPSGELPGLSREVRNEPVTALDGGYDGLDIVNEILEQAPRYLKPGGSILMEIGDNQSKKLATKWGKRTEYESFRFEKDLNGIKRILIARKKAKS